MIDKSRMVHLVFLNPDNTRWYFVRTDRRFDPTTGVWTTWPLADSDPHNSAAMTYEFAEASRRLWSDKPFNLNVRIALDASPTSPFVDPDPKANEALPWPHKNALITVDEQGNILDSPDAPCVYLVRAVHTPNGPMFCLRFEAGVLQNQAQFSTLQEGPEIAVRRAIEKGYNKLEKPQPNPYLEARRREAERRAAEQATRLPNNLRPGDRQ